MPHKVNYGFDDDNDYDYYGEDDDYYLEDEDDKVEHVVPNSSIWRCSICTYDNDQTLLFCDICGTVRNASTTSSVNETKKAVFGVPKDFGASMMAKSLFASSMSCTKLEPPIVLQEFSHELLKKEGHNFYGTGYVYGHFYDFQKTSSECRICMKIDPFNFDTPSPDDVVSGAKHSSGVKLEGNLPKLKNSSVMKNSSVTISDVSSGKRSSSDMRNATVEVTRVKKIESSSIVAKKSNMMRDNYSSTVEDSIQASTSGLGKLSLGTNSAKTIMNPRRCASSAEHNPENWELTNNGEEISRQLTIAVIGHVDSGKSTLCGILLHLMGRISQKEMHKYEKESREKGKGSFSYAWVMDESAGERERGVTMTVGVAHLKTKKYDVVLLDSPGHKDLVPNMISGAVQADAAILVIDASVGSFEAGMEGNGVGQTKEHAQLIRSFGVEQLIVAVNKMDVVDYSFERFKFVKSELEIFLKTCGFKESSVSWIPLSAMENQNLMAPASDSRLSSWYPGPHLLSVIDFLQPPVRDIQKPLCLPICDVMPSEVPGLLAVSGKVEGGAVKSGCTVLVMPSGGTATVHSIVCNSLLCSVVRAGDNVSVNLQGIDEDGLVSGGVLCHPNFPISVATHLELKILVLDVAVPILVGTQVEFHMHHAKETARVLKISSAIDLKSGKVSKRAPRFLLAKQSAVIEVTLDRPTCASTFAENRALGRVSLRFTGNTVAVGIVNRILE